MQINVFGAERRRRWSYDEKVRLVEKTLQAGETVCGVAHPHGVAHSLLFTWRRRRLGGDAGPALFPVEITPPKNLGDVRSSAHGFVIARTLSMKSCVARLRDRFFSVMIATLRRVVGKSTGRTLSDGCLRGSKTQ
jgi:transposase-like protein